MREQTIYPGDLQRCLTELQKEGQGRPEYIAAVFAEALLHIGRALNKPPKENNSQKDLL